MASVTRRQFLVAGAAGALVAPHAWVRPAWAQQKQLSIQCWSHFVPSYDKWFDQRSDRENARSDRTHCAEGVIPAPLWIVLLLSAVIIFGFMLLFADSGERAFVQGVQIGSVVAVIGVTLLLIRYLNHPLSPGYGALQPVAMERTLGVLARERRLVGQSGPLPCDEKGVALAG